MVVELAGGIDSLVERTREVLEGLLGYSSSKVDELEAAGVLK